MRIDSPPSVVAAPVSLRPIEAGDVDAWYAYLSVPEIVRHTSWALRERSELASIVANCESDAPDSQIRFAIVDDRDGALVGTIGLPVVSRLHRTAEVAYDLRPEQAGRGVATACCRAVSDWVLDELGFHRVQATALDTNAASIRVLEKSGFVREGRLANLKIVRGEPRDFFLFAKTRRAPGIGA